MPILKVGGKSFEASQSKVPPCVDHILVPTSAEEEIIELRADCKACKLFADEYDTKTVKVWWDPSKIVLHFETDGALVAREALATALDILEKRFREITVKADRFESSPRALA